MGVEFRVLVAKGVLIPDADLEGVDGLGSTGRVTRYSQGFYCYDDTFRKATSYPARLASRALICSTLAAERTPRSMPSVALVKTDIRLNAMAPQDCLPLIEELKSVMTVAAKADKQAIASARDLKQQGDLVGAYQTMLESVEGMRIDVIRRLDLLERIKAQMQES